MDSHGFISRRQPPPPQIPAHEKRKWAVLKMGHVTPLLRDSDQLMIFVRKLHQLLQEQQMSLEDTLAWTLFDPPDLRVVKRQIEEMIGDARALNQSKLPILVYIDDSLASVIYEDIEGEFSEFLYIVRLEPEEVRHPIATSDYAEIKNICVEFRACIAPLEVNRPAAAAPPLRNLPPVVQPAPPPPQRVAEAPRNYTPVVQPAPPPSQRVVEAPRNLPARPLGPPPGIRMAPPMERTIPQPMRPTPLPSAPRPDPYARPMMPSSSAYAPETRNILGEAISRITLPKPEPPRPQHRPYSPPRRAADRDDTGPQLVDTPPNEEEPIPYPSRSRPHQPPPPRNLPKYEYGFDDAPRPHNNGYYRQEAEPMRYPSNGHRLVDSPPRPSHVPQNNYQPSTNDAKVNPVLIQTNDDSSESAYATPPSMPPPGLSIEAEPSYPPIPVDDVEAALDNFKTGDLDAEYFVDELYQHIGVYNRLHEPFDNLRDNILFIKLIRLSCQKAAVDVRKEGTAILEAAVGSGFVESVLVAHFEPVVESGELQPPNHATCLEVLLDFFDTLSDYEIDNETWHELFTRLHQFSCEISTEVKRCMRVDPDVVFARIYERSYRDFEGDQGHHFLLDGHFRSGPSRSLRSGFVLPTCKEGPPPTLDADPNSNTAALYLECERTEPPNDFRTLASEIAIEDVQNPVKPYVRRMKVKQPFADSEEYLDTVFRLLREDLVSALRDGIAIWKGHNYQMGKDAHGLTADLFLVQDVRVRGVQVKSGVGVPMRMLEIPQTLVQQVIDSRRLSFGQMVALSMDGFQEDCLLGVIVERDDDLLIARRCIGVALVAERDGGVGSVRVKMDTAYHMVESSAFLEMYSPVLATIKGLNRFLPIPFERYIVHGKTNVLPPYYMRSTTPSEVTEEIAKLEMTYMRKRLQKKAEYLKWHQDLAAERDAQAATEAPSPPEDGFQDKKTKKKQKKKTPSPAPEDEEAGQGYKGDSPEMAQLIREITDAENYAPRPLGATSEAQRGKIKLHGREYEMSEVERLFDPGNEIMDHSQKESLLKALRNEFALIQGPPGTGKTFLGVEVVAAMLENRQRWCIIEPILIVCYTNQALDQFLEKIHDRIMKEIAQNRIKHDLPTVVRLGSRCDSVYIKESHKLTKRDVCEAFRDHVPPTKINRGSIYYDFQLAERTLGSAVAILRFGKTKLIGGKHTRSVMSLLHCTQFDREYGLYLDSKNRPMSIDEKLVAWLLNRQFARDPLKLPGSGSNSEEEGESVAQAGRKKKKNNGTEEKLADALQQLDIEKEGKEEDAVKQLALEGEETYEVLEDWYMGRDPVAEADSHLKSVLLFGRPNEGKSGQLQGARSKSLLKNTQDPVVIAAMEEVEELVLGVEPLKAEEADAIMNIVTLPKKRRWQLYAYWRHKLVEETRAQMPRLMATYRAACNAKKELMIKEDANILKHSLIIGATTTGAAKNRDLLTRLNCRQLVVEEAAEVLEAHVLTSFLPSLEHVVLIGDHQQLKPSSSVHQLGRDYFLDVSMFERLYNIGFPHSSLLKQHRMRPEFTEHIVRPHFYPRLEDHETVLKYPSVAGMGKDLFFWTHQVAEETLGYESTSKLNTYEIEQAVALARYLILQAVYQPSDITILCTYTAQTQFMRKEVGQTLGMTPDGKTEVQVETLDGYQGKENKIIILSLVRSNNSEGTIGFLGVKNRICVAWTRAQHGLYVLGNMTFLAGRSQLFNQICGRLVIAQSIGECLPVCCTNHGKSQNIQFPEQLKEKCPEGGCDLECLKKLACEHKCPRKCHPIDDHYAYRCLVIVEKGCKRGKHVDSKPCYEEFGPCYRSFEFKLACGHTAKYPCFTDDADLKCNAPCALKLPCGHGCKAKCGQPCTKICQEEIEVMHPTCLFKHRTKVRCGLAVEFYESKSPCAHPCQEVLACDHICANTCGEDCVFECLEVVHRELPGCGHLEEMLCFQSVDAVNCMTCLKTKKEEAEG